MKIAFKVGALFALATLGIASSKLYFKQAAAQGHDKSDGCVFHTGHTAKNVGESGRADYNGHCKSNCVKVMHISGPNPQSTPVNTPITVSFWTEDALGGPNMLCASKGKVNWGDGPDELMPSEAITDGCGKGLTRIAGSYTPKVILTHTYTKTGRYCLSAQMWGNHKYDGDGSCSYDCTVEAQTIVVVQ